MTQRPESDRQLTAKEIEDLAEKLNEIRESITNDYSGPCKSVADVKKLLKNQSCSKNYLICVSGFTILFF